MIKFFISSNRKDNKEIQENFYASPSRDTIVIATYEHQILLDVPTNFLKP